MSDFQKLSGETDFEYHKRLVYGKLVNKMLADVDYGELAKNVYGRDYSSDVARRMMYGSKFTLELLDKYLENGSDDGVRTRILCLSDFHVPFQLPISTFERYAGRVDILVLNGDLVDMQAISKFPKLYRVSPMDELISGRQYFIDLIDYIHPKRVVINYGNHEMRWSAYFAKNLDADMLELMPETALDLLIDDGFYHYDKRQRTKVWYEPIKNVFEDIKVEYTQSWWTKIGKTIFAHPLAYSSGMLKTAEKAIDYFYRVEHDFSMICIGHTHKLGNYIQGGVSLYEQGACCYTEKMDYTDGRLIYPQQKGYLYLCQDADGDLIQQNTKLEVID